MPEVYTCYRSYVACFVDLANSWNCFSPCLQVHIARIRLQSLDWTSGLDWWTDTKNHFYASNETYSPVGLHDASY